MPGNQASRVWVKLVANIVYTILAGHLMTGCGCAAIIGNQAATWAFTWQAMALEAQFILIGDTDNRISVDVYTLNTANRALASGGVV